MIPLVKEGLMNKFMKSVAKHFGSEVVTSLAGNGRRTADIQWIPTGQPDLDWLLGEGVPRGRVIELYGLEGSGKSTLAAQFAAAFQRAGLAALYVDAEHAIDPAYLQKLGVNLHERAFILSQPDYGEQGLDVTIDAIKSGAFGIIVIDSVAALTPKAELEGDMEKQQMGLQARMMGKGIRKISAIAAKSGTTIIFINQIRTKLNVMWGDPNTTPGGHALKFASSIRLQVKRKRSIEGNKKGKYIGHEVTITAVKNKVTTPFRTIAGALYFGKGIRIEKELV
jgi:recombination protein RecA